MQLTESQRQLFLAISLRLSNATVSEKLKQTRKAGKKTQKLNRITLSESV